MTDPTNGNNRRQSERLPVTLPLEIRREGQRYGIRGETADVSMSGLYYPTMMQMPVDTKIHLTLWFGEESLACNAVVRTADPGVGNGIQFLDHEETAQEALSRFLNSLS